MEQINEELLYALSECKSLNEIRVISLRAKELSHCLKTLAKCQNLLILYLQFNQLSLEDMTVHLLKFKNLIKLDLSFNLIRRIPDQYVFKQLANLKVLYLHNNQISDFNNLQSLASLPQVLLLTLFNNPVNKIPSYRHYLVNAIKSLVALDENIVTDEERIDYTAENLRFRALSLYTKISLPDFEENVLAEQHLFTLEINLYKLKRLYERNSPSIRIQSLYRGYCVRKTSLALFSKTRWAAVVIQKCTRAWLFRLKAKRDLFLLLQEQNLEHLMYSEKQYRQYIAVQKIEMAYMRYLQRKREFQLLTKYALRIQKNYKAALAKSTSFIEALNLRNDSRIYFLREQKLDFYKILKSFCKRFNLQSKLGTLKSMISPCENYQLIRYPNPLTQKRHDFPVLTLSSPTNISRIKKNKTNKQVFGESGSLKRIYTRHKDCEKEKKSLNILKNRLSNVNKEATKIIDQYKVNNEYQQAKYQWDSYQELLVFNPRDSKVCIEVCKIIIQRNYISKNELFLPFFPILLERISSATLIQQQYRSYRIRKAQKRELEKMQKRKELILFYPSEQFMTQTVIQRRAVMCISQCWKYYKLKMRLKALKEMKDYIYSLTSRVLYLEESLYNITEQIVKNNSERLNFIEQYLDFDFEQKRTSFIHDPTKLQAEYEIIVNNLSEITMRFDRNPFPLWLSEICSTFGSIESTSLHFNNVMGIIHKASQTEFTEIMDYNQLVEVERKNIFLNNGLKFVSIHCDTISEARKRALVLAMKTYSLKKRAYLKLFTAEQLSQGIFLRHVLQQWQSFGIKDSDYRMSILLKNGAVEYINLNKERDLQLQYQHCGFLLNHTSLHYFQNDPNFRTIPIQKEVYIEEEKMDEKNQYWYIVMKQRGLSQKKLIVQIDVENSGLNDSSQEIDNFSVVLSQTYINQQLKPTSSKFNEYYFGEDKKLPQVRGQKTRDIVTAPQSAKTGGHFSLSSRKHSQKLDGGQAQSFIFSNRLSLQGSSLNNQCDIAINDEELKHGQTYGQTITKNNFKSFGSQQVRTASTCIISKEIKFKDLKDRYREKRIKENNKKKDIDQIIDIQMQAEKESQQRQLATSKMEEKEKYRVTLGKERFRLNSEQKNRKLSVENHVFQKRVKEHERHFANIFSQMRNLISNSNKSGELKRLQAARVSQRRSIVEQVKQRKIEQKQGSQDYGCVPIKQFDSDSIKIQIQKHKQRVIQSEQVSPRVSIERYPQQYSNREHGRILYEALKQNSEFKRDQLERFLEEEQLEKDSSSSMIFPNSDMLKQTFQNRFNKFTKGNVLKRKELYQYSFIQEGFPTVPVVPQINVQKKRDFRIQQ